MLAKLETAYLSILRVIILVVATIALVVAAIALAGAVPPLLHRLTPSQGSQSPQPSLSAFISEKKVEGTTSVKDLGPDAGSYVDPNVKDAAQNLTTYLKGRSPLAATDWQNLIDKSDGPVPITHIYEYHVSLKALTVELLSAKGKPLSLDRVGELLTWHQQHYVEAVNQQDALRAADTTKSISTLSVAGGAFLFFVAVVFLFLFVKIERSLRLVKTSSVTLESDHE